MVFGLLSSFSKLVQQIGRAGRDGDQAYAITYTAQWVKDIPQGLQKGTKQEATNLKRREVMCQVLRGWFNTSSMSCPQSVFCDHFDEHTSQPKNCCIYHHKALPSMDPVESTVQQFSSSHTKTPMVRSDGTYESFREKRFAAFRDSAFQMIAVWARQTWEEVRGEDTLLPSTAFFPEALQKRLSEKIHVVTSVEHLCGILHDWNHLNSHKLKLFKFCGELLKNLDDLRKEVQDIHEAAEDSVEKTKPVKIKIPALKQKVCEEDLTDMRPSKRQRR